ncbi:MAG TPA: aldolase/citrate lyase family protein [bacterium]|nr:aldolase/citrate lyase family protein [bacterium]
MTKNAVKARLAEGGTAIGTMVSEMRSEEIAYILAAAGFDFLVIDTEHGSASYETLQRIGRGARSAGIVPIVRVPDIAYPFIARTLDTGVLGLMVPHVEAADDARRIVRCAKYPPAGERGFGLRAGVTDYTGASVPEAIAWSNAETMILAQVESRRCLDHLDEIAAVPGIDVLLIGPTDLSISLGVPGELLHPTMQEAYRRVVDVATRHHVAAGIHPSDIEVVQHGRDIGMRLLMYANDARLLVAAGRQTVEALRPTPR